MELRRHIDQLEEERHLESERKKEEKKERAKTETEQYQMLALANENLDRDRTFFHQRPNFIYTTTVLTTEFVL